MKIPVFKLKKKDEDKFITADVVDGSVQILSDTGDNKQKWYVKNKKKLGVVRVYIRIK